MRWQKGQEGIDELLGVGELERSGASIEQARALLGDGKHYLAQLRSPETIAPALRRRLAFRAMASSAEALLAAQGLRPSATGGVAAVQRAVDAQFSGGPGPGVFDALTELSRPPVGEGVPDDGVAAAEWAVTFAVNLLDSNNLRTFSGGEISTSQ